MIEDFNGHVQNSNSNCPPFSVGTLEEVLNKAFYPDALEDVRLAL